MKCFVCSAENQEKNIIKCHNCGHVFRNYPVIDLGEYYSKKYRSFKDNQKLEDTVYEQRNLFILEKISSFIGEQKTLFEVGFGYGHFYDLFKKKFPNINYSCCELSEPLARSNQLKGIDTLNCSFEDVVDRKFDIIASFDVLEHFYNPKNYINKVNELLNIGGLAIIQVPTDRKLHFRKPFDGHYHYFSKQSLTNLVGNSYRCKMFYKTNPGETAGGREYLTVFERVK
jgi:SAM-dependent methyltransferase